MYRLTPLGAVILVVAMVATARKWADYDIFWHLANGRLMVESGIFPSPDRFSWSMNDQLYVAYSAQVDRLFYLLWKAGGTPVLGVFAPIAFGLTLLPFALLVGRLTVRPLVEALVLVLMVFALLPFKGARPHLLGFVLFGLVVYLLERPFGFRKALAVGIALGMWANLHGSFLVGFGVVSLAVFAWISARDVSSTVAASFALAIGFVSSLFSPYGFRLWYYPFKTLSNPTLAAVNPDWTSLRPISLAFWAMGVLLLAVMCVGIWKTADPRSLAAVAMLLPVIQIARFSPFAAPLLALVTLERMVDRVPGLKVDPNSELFALMTSRKTSTLAWSLLLAGILPIGPMMSTSLEAGAFRPLPVHAVDTLLSCADPAPVWNDYNWGGYLLWRGDAQYTVGIDGRAETLYSNHVFDQYLTVSQAQDGWQAIVQASPAQYALMPTGVLAAIDELPGWRHVFQDDVATLYVRDGAAWRCQERQARG